MCVCVRACVRACVLLLLLFVCLFLSLFCFVCVSVPICLCVSLTVFVVRPTALFACTWWGTADAEIKVSFRGNPELSKTPSVKFGVGRIIALPAFPTAANLLSCFTLSRVVKKKKK